MTVRNKNNKETYQVDIEKIMDSISDEDFAILNASLTKTIKHMRKLGYDKFEHYVDFFIGGVSHILHALEEEKLENEESQDLNNEDNEKSDVDETITNSFSMKKNKKTEFDMN